MPFLLLLGSAVVTLAVVLRRRPVSHFVWPLASNKIRGGIINHTFGMVRNSGTRAHQGWDLLAPPGTPVFAVSSGIIESVTQSGAYGLMVILRSDLDFQGSAVWVLYAHLSDSAVTPGQRVNSSSLIGYAGMTGNASSLHPSEAHLHIEFMTQPTPTSGLGGRIDPLQIYGFIPF